MKTITDNTVIAFHCDTLDMQGNTVETSRGKLPCLYLFGDESIPKALQRAMIGCRTGDSISVKLKPEDAYGLRDPELVQTLPVDALPLDATVNVGDCLVAHTEAGERTVRIIALDEESVILDGNHPLSGQELLFEIEIRNIRCATDKELKASKAIA